MGDLDQTLSTLFLLLHGKITDIEKSENKKNAFTHETPRFRAHVVF